MGAKKDKIREGVRWYSLFEMRGTLLHIAVSAAIGGRMRVRDMPSFATPEEPFAVDQQDSIWIDYVADLGDAERPTYTVARLLAAPSLRLTGGEETEARTRRGDILIMGGDEVYPVGTREAYRDRLLTPYDKALEDIPPVIEGAGRTFPAEYNDKNPTLLFAIPGNHDWYDGLVAFQRLFCQGRVVTGRKTKQSRSYFALKLPHDWWIWGLDIELEADINKSQLAYFWSIADEFPKDREQKIILMVAEPHWLKGGAQENLAYLEDQLIATHNARLTAVIAGDYHHYQRHVSQNDKGKIQWIVAGGGGAFLHPTHGALSPDHPKVERVEEQPQATEARGKKRRKSLHQLANQKRFPEVADSKKLAWGALLFTYKNRSASIAGALLYLLTAGAWPTALRARSAEWSVFDWAVHVLTLRSFFGLIALFALGVWLCSDRPRRHLAAFRISGLIHIAVHVFALAALTHSVSWLPQYFSPAALEVSTWVIFVGAGTPIFGIILGAYFYSSARWFGVLGNAAYSAFRSEDYKNFLRMKIDAESCTIYAVGIKDTKTTYERARCASKLATETFTLIEKVELR